jgi:Septum formation
MRAWPHLIAGLALAAMGGCSADTLEMGPDGSGGGFTDVTAVTLPATTAPADEAAAAAAPWPYDEGSCVTWDQDAPIPEFEIVSCEDEHLVEVTTVFAVEVASGEAIFPTRADLAAFSDEYCDPAAVQYLAGDLPSAVEAGAIPPSPDEWSAGERWIACTIGRTRVEGRRPAYTGSLADPQ